MPEPMSADFRPTASLENLRRRAALLRQLRAFFDERGFLEVQTPVLSADTVVDRHIEPFCISGQWLVASGQRTGGRDQGTGVGDQRTGIGSQDVVSSPLPFAPSSAKPLWLQTSPEFAMKRLLAAGAGAIYEVARVFRVDELGPLHNPEFTLVEWYRPGDDMDQGMQLTSDLCDALLQRGPAERISYRAAFEKYVGVDPHTAAGPQLAALVQKLDIAAPESMPLDDRDGWLDLLLVERIQPHLGATRPALLYDYPASQAALARVRDDNPPVAERFELYVDGIELANGYHELLDPQVLRARNAATNAQRRAEGKSALPEESRLLAAMEAGLPAAVGVALGFDRLAMLALGAAHIAEVMAFPFDRA